MIVAVVGDEAGLFGHGTSGEGCDVAELKLPGVQEELLQALADTGLPVVAVLVTGRPYALGAVAGRLAAVVQAFFPGEEGGGAIAGRAHRAGDAERQAAGRDPARRRGAAVDLPAVAQRRQAQRQLGRPDAAVRVRARAVVHHVRVRGPGAVRGRGGDRRRGGDFLHRAQHRARSPGPRWSSSTWATRSPPWCGRRSGWPGSPGSTLAPGEAARGHVPLHADRTSFTGRDLTRIVEPGTITVTVGGSSDDLPLTGSFTLTGPLRTVGIDRVLDTPVSVKKLTG